MAVSIPLATASYHGNFQWDRADNPKIFSLLFGKPSPLAPSSIKDAMMLYLKVSKGTGWIDQDLVKSVKQAIFLPSSIDAMINNINNFACASEIFLG